MVVLGELKWLSDHSSRDNNIMLVRDWRFWIMCLAGLQSTIYVEGFVRSDFASLRLAPCMRAGSNACGTVVGILWSARERRHGFCRGRRR